MIADALDQKIQNRPTQEDLVKSGILVESRTEAKGETETEVPTK